MFRPPGDCPICGTFVPKGRKACQECGADEMSGWQEDDAHDGLDLPESSEDFDYEGFLEQEFGSGVSKKKQLPSYWKITAVLLIVVLAVTSGIWWSYPTRAIAWFTTWFLDR